MAPGVPLRYALLRWLIELAVTAAFCYCPGMRVTRGSRRTDLSVFHLDYHHNPATCGGRLSIRGAVLRTRQKASGPSWQGLRRPPVWSFGTAERPQTVFLFHRSGGDFSLHGQRKVGAGSPRCSAHPPAMSGKPQPWLHPPAGDRARFPAPREIKPAERASARPAVRVR